MTDWRNLIERRPEVLGGKPIIRGTRISVELLLQRLGDGWTESQLIESFPNLQIQHIRAAQSYASAALAGDEIIEISNPAA